MVPTFTAYRSVRSAPSYTPAASPRLRRRLSAWPPHRLLEPASELTRLLEPGHVLQSGPYPPDWSRRHRYGASTTGSLALRLLTSLAGPGSSGSADPPRRCRGCFPPSPAIPGSGCRPLHQTAATARRWSPSISTRIHSASWRTQQLMPFTATARQPRHLDAQHDAHMIQPNLRHQPLETRPGIGSRRRMAQVLIDHQHPRRRPPQPNRPLGQPILQPGGLLVILDLLRGGLTHIHSRQAITVPRPDLALQPLPRPSRRAHPVHPRPRPSGPPMPSSARPAGPAGTPPAPGSPPETPPSPAPRPAGPLTGGRRCIC